MNVVKTTLAMALAAGLAPVAMAQTADMATADTPTVEPDAYSGLWYEIARTPTPFQQQCVGGVTAYYEALDDDLLRVLNRCDLADGGTDSVEGTAEEVGDDFAMFSVAFPGSPDDASIDYVVQALGPEQDGQYSWAAVTGGDGEMAWILARDPELDDDARQEAEEALEEAGADISALQSTVQPPETYDPDQQ